MNTPNYPGMYPPPANPVQTQFQAQTQMNNYQQQLNNLQRNANTFQALAEQYRQVPQAPMPTPSKPISGRMVNNSNDIKPNEVPMDGSVSLFMTEDYAHIYAKAWNSDGLISTVEYVPKPPDKPVEDTPNMSTSDFVSFQKEMFTRLDKLENMLKKNRQPFSNYKQSPKSDQTKKTEVPKNDES